MVKTDLDGARAAWLRRIDSISDFGPSAENGLSQVQGTPPGVSLISMPCATQPASGYSSITRRIPRSAGIDGSGSIALVDRYTQSFQLTDLSVIETGAGPLDCGGYERVGPQTGGWCIGVKTLPPSLPPKAGLKQISADLNGQKVADRAEESGEVAFVETCGKRRFDQHRSFG